MDGHYGVAIGQAVLLGRVRQLLVDNHHVLRQRDASAQQIVETIDRALHPINERKVRDGVQEGDVRPTFQQQNDWVQRGFRFEMSAQRNDEIVDAVRRIVSGQDDRFVLPLVLLGIAVAAVLTYLRIGNHQYCY